MYRNSFYTGEQIKTMSKNLEEQRVKERAAAAIGKQVMLSQAEIKALRK